MHRLSPRTTSSAEVKPGRQAVRVTAAGEGYKDLSFEFENIGTSISMTAANAVQLLSLGHKSALMSLLGTTPNSKQLRGWLNVVCEIYERERSSDRDIMHASLEHSLLLTTAPASDDNSDTVDSCGSTNSKRSSLAAHSPPNALRSLAFDGIVAALGNFRRNAGEYDVRGADPAVIVDRLSKLLLEVMYGELSLLTTDNGGNGSCSNGGIAAANATTPPSDELLEDWEHAHMLRQQHHAAEGHPLSSLEFAPKVLPLYKNAVQQAHPALQGLRHIGMLSV